MRKWNWTAIISVLAIVTAIAGVSIQWGVSKNRLDTLEKKQINIETNYKSELLIVRKDTKTILQQLGIIQGQLKRINGGK